MYMCILYQIGVGMGGIKWYAFVSTTCRKPCSVNYCTANFGEGFNLANLVKFNIEPNHKF